MSFEKVAVIEGNVFWKSSRSKTVVTQKIASNTEYSFAEKFAFF